MQSKFTIHRRSVFTGAVAFATLTAAGKLAAAQTAPRAAQAGSGQVRVPTEAAHGALEVVATFDGAMPTGVTVSRQGRIFVNFPKWGDDVRFTVAELRGGRPVAYPDEVANRADSGNPGAAFVSVQSVVVDPADRLWVLDTGRPNFAPARPGGPKLVGIDLSTNRIIRTIAFPPETALPTSYLNDVRFDLRRGNGGTAFITDSSNDGPNGIVVVDLASGISWRRLHDHPSTKAEELQSFMPMVEGRPFLERKDGAVRPGASMGSDGIAISADGQRLYYTPLGSRRLYSVSTQALADRMISHSGVEQTVRDEGDKGGAADGLESDASGRIYATNYEHNAIQRRSPGGIWETIVHDPRLLWPDTLSVAADGYLYVTANQLHRQARFNEGRDLRQKPYMLFRTRIGEQPVALR